MKKKALISIIIPTYNSSVLILKTLHSVINQDYKDYEIIIIDSYSVDDTIIKIKSLKNKRIRIFFTKKEKGLSYARYFGILKSTGKYIAFLDSDDEWKNNKLMKQIKFMKKYKSVFSCTNFQLKKNNNIQKVIIKKNKIFFNDLLADRPIALSSVIILRDIILNVAKNNHSDTYAEDYLWWVLVLKKNYRCDVIKSNLTTINIIKNSRSVKFLLNYMALIRIYNENLKISFGRIFVIIMLLIYNTFSKNLFKYKFFFLNK
jgi:teichuronic acid biosynthesis glycosyltransferase TuaG